MFSRNTHRKTSLKGKAAWFGKRTSVKNTTVPDHPCNFQNLFIDHHWIFCISDLVETQRVVRVTRRSELITECELGKLDRAMEITHVPCQPALNP